jgi:hypothetical protein
MTYNQANHGRLLCEDLFKIYAQLNDEERVDADLRACQLADADELRKAFLCAIEERLDFPGLCGELDDEGNVVKPFESERPVLETLLADITPNLSIDTLIDAGKEIIAEREPAEPMAAEAEKAADAA